MPGCAAVTVVLLLVLAAALALVDWVGVVSDDRHLRWIGKPGTMIALLAAAVPTFCIATM